MKRRGLTVQFAAQVVHLDGQLVDDEVLLSDLVLEVVLAVLQLRHATVVLAADARQFV